jgi:Protein of unknown function DUF262
MTSAPIEGRGCTIHQLFDGHRYQLDYYQREYTWESENVRRLAEDLYRRFSAEWDVRHDRRNTSRYKPYFLGPYVGAEARRSRHVTSRWRVRAMPAAASISAYPTMITRPAHWGGACGNACPGVIMTLEATAGAMTGPPSTQPWR